MSTELPFRQIHLDFHTSPHIPAVAVDFDADSFAKQMADAHVNSVTCFARCHHGYLYYASAQNPDRIHPQLQTQNLLLEQIEACHRQGIRVPIYTTVQWDDFSADLHRDWLLLDEQGKEYKTAPLEPGFYRFLDVYHPGYRAFLKQHVRELLSTLPVDGLFFDIVQARPSLAKHWLEGMDARGLNPEDKRARERFAAEVMTEWKLEMSAFVRDLQPGCPLFYNAGHVGPRQRTSFAAYSHFEVESLPSGGWGYAHFPATARYVRGLGHDYLGMTGKFHTSWGDFGSYKSKAALQYECATMLALGAKCSIGDQLHPSGRLDPVTYELIGSVYQDVEQKEPWCSGAEAVVDIGLLSPEAFLPAGGERIPPAALGAARLLQELHLQFSVVDAMQDFSAYQLLVLPDLVPVDPPLAVKLEQYLAAGGAVLLSYRSGLTPEGDGFASDNFGVKRVGEAPYSPDFLVPGEQFVKGLHSTEYVMYQRGLEVTAAAGTDVLAQVNAPYFNRSWSHFCSHLHTPSSGERAYPAVTRQGRVIYFAHPVFGQYGYNAPPWCKQLVSNAVDLLLPRKLVEVTAPGATLVTLNRQPAQERYVLHLVYAAPERKGQIDVIEDVVPLFDVPVSIEIQGVKAVRTVPDAAPLPFESRGDRTEFTVPVVQGHQIVEIDLSNARPGPTGAKPTVT